MAYLGLAAGLLLPWILGIVWLRVRWLRPEHVNWPTLLGYGYLTGTLATVLVMRLFDLIGIRFGFISVGATLLALIVVGIWAGRGTPLRRPNLTADWNELCGWKKVAYAVLLAVIIVRVVGLGLETFWRPLFPWDAWQQWATKARVWYEFGRVVPFVSQDMWLGDKTQGMYTDFAPQYPAAVPLLQTWTALSLGRWDDALINQPWFGCAVALALAFYGQARRWEVSPLFALGFTYFLTSLPMLDTHVALAGYADLFMAVFFGLAAIAFFHWARTAERWQGVTATILAVGCAFIKQPGIVWMALFLPALWVVKAPRAAGVGLPIVAVVTFITLTALGELGNFEFVGYSIQSLRNVAILGPMWQNLMVLDNWHMLWHLAVLAVILSWSRLFAREYSGMTALISVAMYFLAIVFVFTKARAWAEDYTTLNRAFLHTMPMLTFYVMVLFREAVWAQFARR